MEDAFFSQLDGNAVRELLLRTELRHAALFAVSDTLRIERCSDAAVSYTHLDVYKRQPTSKAVTKVAAFFFLF